MSTQLNDRNSTGDLSKSKTWKLRYLEYCQRQLEELAKGEPGLRNDPLFLAKLELRDLEGALHRADVLLDSTYPTKPPSAAWVETLVLSGDAGDFVENMSELFSRWVILHGRRKARRIFFLQCLSFVARQRVNAILTKLDQMRKIIR